MPFGAYQEIGWKEDNSPQEWQHDIDVRLRDVEDKLYGHSLVGAPTMRQPVNNNTFVGTQNVSIYGSGGALISAWQIDSDIFFGPNLAQIPQGISLALFGAAQTYNGESMGVGDILLANDWWANLFYDYSSGEFSMRYQTTKIERWDSNGSHWMGTDLSGAGGTLFAIIHADATVFNGESFDTGDLLLGRNAASQTNLLRDYSTGDLRLRTGTTTLDLLLANGNHFIGIDTGSVPGGVTLAIFRATTTYSGENFDAGDFMLSANSYMNLWYDASQGEMAFRAGTTKIVSFSYNGNHFMGSSVGANPSTITFCLFGAASTSYNGETFAVDDLLIGENSASHANIFLDRSADKIYFRGGTTANNYINTNGDLYCRSGTIRFGSTGMEVRSSDAWGRYIFLYNDQVTTYTSGYAYIEYLKDEPHVANHYGALRFGTYYDASNYTFTYYYLGGISTYINTGGTARYVYDVYVDYFDFSVPLRLESWTTAPADNTGYANVFFKAGKFIIQWRDGAQVRYKYLDITGTGVTWVHSTTLP